MKKRRFIVQTSKVIMALAVILGGQTALAQAVHIAPVVSVAKAAAANTVTIDGFEYSKDVAEALNYLNTIRESAGLKKAKLNPFLVKSAQSHASYLVTNKENGHGETKGKPGFTGEGIRDRIEGVSGSTFKYSYVNEGINFSTSSPSKAIDALIYAPLHRDALLDPNLTELGVGVSGNTVVIDYVFDGKSVDAAVYPYNGQKNVPLFFDGYEVPNPLEEYGLKESGYVISYKLGNSPASITATLKDSKGQDVPVFVKNGGYTSHRTDLGSALWLIIPKKRLTAGETYTVNANSKTWSFTTAGSATQTPTPQPSTGTQQPPRKFSTNDVGVRLDGKYIELTPRAKIVNGSTFIPLRGVFEAMGATLKWTPAPSSVRDSSGKAVKPDYDGTVKITKGSTIVEIYVGTNRAFVDGRAVTLAVPSFISAEGSTYVPLRFASEALGAKVGWEADNWTAVIDTTE